MVSRPASDLYEMDDSYQDLWFDVTDEVASNTRRKWSRSGASQPQATTAIIQLSRRQQRRWYRPEIRRTPEEDIRADSFTLHAPVAVPELDSQKNARAANDPFPAKMAPCNYNTANMAATTQVRHQCKGGTPSSPYCAYST